MIATFVTLADMMLQAYAPVQHKELGAFIALIVVNCMILGRQEAFSAKNNVFRSLLDAIGTGIGFTIALVMMGGFREILGTAPFWKSPLFGPNFEPWVVMVLPAGGFLTLGFILLAMGYFEERKKAKWQLSSGDSSMNDQTLFSIFFSAMVVNNFTLAMFLGLCPFMGVSARVETALRMGLANIFVLVLTSLSAWFLNTYVLESVPFLRIISFIIVVASLVQIVEMVVKKYPPPCSGSWVFSCR